MSVQSPCKGCREEYRATEEQIDRLLDHPMFQADSEISVPDSVYLGRLEQCMSCPRLSAGTTCLVCGCFVRVAAKYRNRACPLAGESRWAKFET